MSNDRKKILAILGSTRNKSSNESILKFIANSYSDVLDVKIYKEIANLPHFNPDASENPPQGILEFRDLIMKADGVIICTPEYVFSLPGTLKNAIEWTVSTTVFSNKPVALIVASASGEKACESLVLIMQTIEAKIGKHAALLLRGARSKVNLQEQITDKEVLKEIDALVLSLIETINETGRNNVELLKN